MTCVILILSRTPGEGVGRWATAPTSERVSSWLGPSDLRETSSRVSIRHRPGVLRKKQGPCHEVDSHRPATDAMAEVRCGHPFESPEISRGAA